ncbi:MAG TPA: OmpA family protein [Blastocatellia bacterium]|nr:OmpA family protein [Blastocatellia bacterium]
MKITKTTVSRAAALVLVLLCAGAQISFAQDDGAGQSRVRQVAAGQKVKIKGVIVDRQPDTITVRDMTKMDTVVLLTNGTSVKSNGGFMRSGTNYDETNLLRGLICEVEGVGDSQGQLVASKIRFDKQDLKTATALDSRVAPVEERVTKVEAQNKALAGQVDELSELSKMAKEEAEKATAEAARANEGVELANQRISNLDNFDVSDHVSVLFAVSSAVLTPEAKQQLDAIVEKALASKGYVIEVAGYTDTTGRPAKNQVLSQQRADAVVRYLTGVRNIPLRRVITPTGYGSLKPVEPNTTAAGRGANRRVEVNLLINKGITSAPAS